jgi:acetyl-CoA carboxylase carboxyltransferase component
MNDSAGAYVPAGVGGLDGYAEAFTALRKISGVVPSIMCMFGYNAGGGSYLPRQGSFVIQPDDTFFGLTGPGVVKSVLGEDVTPDELGGPGVHSAVGRNRHVGSRRGGRAAHGARCSRTCPATTASSRRSRSSDPSSARPGISTSLLRRRRSTRRPGFNTPIDISILIQQLCDHGDFFEIQPQRARNTVTALRPHRRQRRRLRREQQRGRVRARSISTRPTRTRALCASATSTTSR